MAGMALPTFIARRDFKLRARIVGERKLVYDGPHPTDPPQRPKYVRAGSGVAWTGERMVVVQDDADYIAVIEGNGTSVAALPLRGLSGARYGKSGAGHLNLEAVLSARDWRGEFVLAFGSGVGADKRGVARVRLEAGNTELSIFETRKLYQALEDLDGFATSELNVEGVALLPKWIEGRDAIRLFHRGNRAARPGTKVERHVSATVDLRLDSLLAYLDRCKRDPNAFLGFDLHNARRYDLDEYEGASFTFSDAAGLPGDNPGRTAYIAIAEAHVEGGPSICTGTALGVLETDGQARYTIIVERDGSVSRRQAEGMVLSSPTAGYLVVQDDADAPATLATIEITGL